MGKPPFLSKTILLNLGVFATATASLFMPDVVAPREAGCTAPGNTALFLTLAIQLVTLANMWLRTKTCEPLRKS